MSTFGGLQTAYSGLVAARAAIDLTGQNIANATTDGYTRQRVSQSAVGSVSSSSIFRTGVNIGQGVQIDRIARLGDSILDSRVRAAASSSGYWKVASSAVSTIETSLNEPGSDGLSVTLSDFWSAWQNLSNNAGSANSAGPGATLLAQAGQLVSRIADGYAQASAGWSDARTAAQTAVQAVNTAAGQVAQLNDQIRRTVASGGSANELLDQRSLLLTNLAGLTGATVRENPDNTVDVVLGGNALVAGTTSRALTLGGAARLEDAAANPAHLEWAGGGGTVDLDGGELAGRLATMGPAETGGTGGPFAEAAALYNTLATTLYTKVNAIHSSAVTYSGATGGRFFALNAAIPSAALGLSVVPTDVSQIAAAASGKGGADGSKADEIADLASALDGPDSRWATYVVQVGVAARTSMQQAVLSDQSAVAATTAQSSQSAVDLDEETMNLLTFQHAYQGAARVLTAMDEMLDTLINRTGVVGR
ncbi:MAG: flagellar biosynthesis protein FlgK [Naasia sp.]|jgi:flagellar hook-associated protein 1 FlgK|uniref:flagellar hook-associated protein FlgK n=1 Tax=Naasia sp. TaxID=2546198 RepID=UPI00262484EE|nr:flagellar hook-associated protein FlgK [Naasia sp.]MCU1570092.1 flagellar biosynthesis protein FlgK [Naasia sp.]